ncbi:MAG: amidohydrolase, partial [Spirochaetota bacterium]|nr:amidohydrolase [Spirochaetota bacterium]
MKIKLLLILFIICALFTLPVTEEYLFAEIEDDYEETGTEKQFNIIDVHEHIRSYPVVEKYWPARKKHNIKGMVLVGSPKETLGLMINSKNKWFTKPDINNKVVLKIARDYPGKFYPFVTFSPDDEDQVEKLKSYVEEGAKGVKLYNGHSNFYKIIKIPLNAPHLMDLYAYCEKNEIPMIFHVNLNKYWDEFLKVLDAHPKLKVNIPHYGLLLRKLSKVEHILKTYPNTYFDVSFGHFYFAYIGMKRISRNNKRMRKFITKYKNR